MEIALNTIIDNACTAAKLGVPKLNVYPKGSLRHTAYELGRSQAGEAVLATREDGQVFAVAEVEPGDYQSVVPRDLAEQSLGQCHTSLKDAVDYLRELIARHGVSQALA